MNIKTINQLPETSNTKGMYSIVMDKNDVSYKYKLDYDSLTDEFDKKADKSEIPTKLSQLEQDIDSPIDFGESENSAVLRGGNNMAVLKGWYYKAIQFNENKGYIYLYLTTEQQIPKIVTSFKEVDNPEKTIPFDLSRTDGLSIVNDVKYDKQFILHANEVLQYGRITLKPIDYNFPFTDIKTDEDLLNGIFDKEDYSVYSVYEPFAGIADMGDCSISMGNSNKATNGNSSAFGFNNHAYGKFSFVEGRDNNAGYASHAEGQETSADGLVSHSEGKYSKALGDVSHAEGRGTIAEGKCSHSEGRECKAIGANSHAEGQLTESKGNNSHASGYKTITNNSEEVAFGRFNKSTPNITKFSFGIGQETERKNAYEITSDGEHFIIGIGGYDGTNPQRGVNDLVTYVKTLENRILELENIIN